MVEFNSDDPRDQVEIDIPALIAQFDPIVDNPEKRAKRVWTLIQEQELPISNWDMICFCVHYLGFSLQSAPWIPEASVHELNKHLYLSHYIAVAPRMADEPDVESRNGPGPDSKREGETIQGESGDSQENILTDNDIPSAETPL